jgi:hypothetical protein
MLVSFTSFMSGLLMVATMASSAQSAQQDLLRLGTELSLSICGGEEPVRVETLPNPHVDGNTELVEVRSCASGESRVVLTRTDSESRRLPLSVIVISTDVPLPSPIRIGAATEGVQGMLGAPVEVAGGRQSYSLSESDDMLVIESRDGIIISVTWHFYAG